MWILLGCFSPFFASSAVSTFHTQARISLGAPLAQKPFRTLFPSTTSFPKSITDSSTVTGSEGVLVSASDVFPSADATSPIDGAFSPRRQNIPTDVQFPAQRTGHTYRIKDVPEGYLL
uniref:Uncharacterized protein n=1 Tax=Tetraselmis sp. GSL018 TaxID=582737 RepID=A0A061SFQ3_9CHLO